MTFEQLVSNYGVGLAVLIAKEALPHTFWNKVTLEQAVQIYLAAELDVELRANMWRKITHTDATFPGVMNVLENVADEKLRSALIKRLYNTADTFMQHARVLELDYGGRYGNLSFRKMVRKASGPREKMILAHYVDPNSPLYSELMSLLERSSRSFTDEFRVWKIAKDTELGKRAFRRMQRIGSFQQWYDFYRKHASTPALIGQAHYECYRLAGNDYHLLQKLDVPVNSAWKHFEEYCNRRCQTAETFAARLNEYEHAGKYAAPEVRNGLRSLLASTATTLEERMCLYDKIPELRVEMLSELRRMYSLKG